MKMNRIFWAITVLAMTFGITFAGKSAQAEDVSVAMGGMEQQAIAGQREVELLAINVRNNTAQRQYIDSLVVIVATEGGYPAFLSDLQIKDEHDARLAVVNDPNSDVSQATDRHWAVVYFYFDHLNMPYV